MIATIDLQDVANSFPSGPDNKIVVTAACCHLESDACVPFFAISCKRGQQNIVVLNDESQIDKEME